MANQHSRSTSTTLPPLAPSRRHAKRVHSDSYNPIYSASSSASSDTSSIFSYASSSSSATSISTSRRAVSHNLPREGTHLARPPSLPTPTVSVSFCSPDTGNTKIALPRTLARPKFKDVSPAALVAAGAADLKHVPLPYIIQALKDVGPRMMAALGRTTVPAPKSLPRDLKVYVTTPDPDPDPGLNTLPTHLLALYSRETTPAHQGEGSPTPRRKVTLCPTHAVMLAAHCAHLPPLPPGGKPTLREPEDDTVQGEGQVPGLSQPVDKNSVPADGASSQNEDQTTNSSHDPTPAGETPPPPESAAHDHHEAHTALTLPVVPFCIPAPHMFPTLQAYIYTKRADSLLGALLPGTPAAAPSAPPAPDSIPPLSPPLSPSPPPSESDSTPRPSPAPSTPTPTPPPPLVADAAALAAQLAVQHDAATLVHAALRTHGLWADAAALGVFDDGLWRMLDFAWRALLGAFERGADTESDAQDDGEMCSEADDASMDEEDLSHRAEAPE